MTSRRSASPIRNVLSHAKSVDVMDVSTGLVYGDVGTHKTETLCSALKVFDPSEILIISPDHRDPTLARFPDIKAVDLLSLDGTVHENMKSLILEFKGLGSFPFKFIAVDSISKLTHYHRLEVIKERNRRYQEQYNGTPHPSPDVPEQRDYQIVQNRVVEYVWDLRNLALKKGFHFWITAWERNDFIKTEDNPDGFFYFFPDLPPELGRLIRGEFDFLARSIQKDSFSGSISGGQVSKQVTPGWEFHFGGYSSEASKNKLNLPTVVRNPTVSSILQGRYSVDGRGVQEEEEGSTESQTEEG